MRLPVQSPPAQRDLLMNGSHRDRVGIQAAQGPGGPFGIVGPFGPGRGPGGPFGFRPTTPAHNLRDQHLVAGRPTRLWLCRLFPSSDGAHPPKRLITKTERRANDEEPNEPSNIPHAALACAGVSGRSNPRGLGQAGGRWGCSG